MKRSKQVYCALLWLLLTLPGYSQPAGPQRGVVELPRLRGWALQTGSNTYILASNSRNELVTLYWGPRLSQPQLLTTKHFEHILGFAGQNGGHRQEGRFEEYPGWGGAQFDEPALKISTASGNRDLKLRFEKAEITEDGLAVIMKDIADPIFVRLVYRVYAENGILAKKSVVENKTQEAITLESAQSGVWSLPAAPEYRLTYLAGDWGNEAHLTRETINQGIKVLESRTGVTGYNSNPWFAMDAGGTSTENAGNVWFGALGWSGNWRISVEQTNRNEVRVTGGYNPFDFGYVLKPGESLDTPWFYGGFTENGFGEASRMLHRVQLEHLVPQGAKVRPRPVFFNSWQIYETDVNEGNQMALAEKAAALGVELFLVDDGWFHLRKTVRAGLGDWYADTDKFPAGLKPLARHVNKLGMDFGLWVEPEMINEDSDLYRLHPDWAIRFRDRKPSEGRWQLVLNLARTDVKEHLIEVLDKLVSENDIRFFKWDMNRYITEPGWPEVPAGEQKNFWVKYTDHLYEIMGELRKRHPKLEIESCKGGGGRFDMGILPYVDQFWTSDNTDPIDRLSIQEGFSYAYAPHLIMGRVPPVANKKNYRNVRTDASLAYRFLVAMNGSLGVSLNLNELTPEEETEASGWIRRYKEVRNTIQFGGLYRLSSPRESNITVNQYVSRDGSEAVVFGILTFQKFYGEIARPVRLQGLDPRATYSVRAADPEKIAEKIETATGEYLMNIGIHFNFPRKNMDGTMIILRKIP